MQLSQTRKAWVESVFFRYVVGRVRTFSEERLFPGKFLFGVSFLGGKATRDEIERELLAVSPAIYSRAGAAFSPAYAKPSLMEAGNLQDQLVLDLSFPIRIELHMTEFFYEVRMISEFQCDIPHPPTQPNILFAMLSFFLHSAIRISDHIIIQ